MKRSRGILFGFFLGLCFSVRASSTPGCSPLDFNRRYSAGELNALAGQCPRYAQFKNDRWQAIKNSVVNLNFGTGPEKKTPNCGGLLIDATYVLTAYHCVEGFYKNPYVFQKIIGQILFDRVWFLIPEHESRGFRYETFPKERFSLTLVKLDPARDLALIKLAEPIDNFSEPTKVLTFADLEIDTLAQRKHLLAISSQEIYPNNFVDYGVLNFVKLWPDRTLTDNLNDSDTYFDEIYLQAIWNRHPFNENDSIVLSFFTSRPKRPVITHGDSGSPVFTFDGHLVGLVAGISGKDSKPFTYGGKTPALISKIPPGWLIR